MPHPLPRPPTHMHPPQAPDAECLERFLGRLPLVMNVVIMSPHGYFGQSNVLGLPDTGGQVGEVGAGEQGPMCYRSNAALSARWWLAFRLLWSSLQEGHVNAWCLVWGIEKNAVACHVHEHLILCQLPCALSPLY
jgi:hypothetical protein